MTLFSSAVLLSSTCQSESTEPLETPPPSRVRRAAMITAGPVIVKLGTSGVGAELRGTASTGVCCLCGTDCSLGSCRHAAAQQTTSETATLPNPKSIVSRQLPNLHSVP